MIKETPTLRISITISYYDPGDARPKLDTHILIVGRGSTKVA